MDTSFNNRNWTLELEPDVPAYLPIPEGHPCIINGIYAADNTAKKIVLEAKIQIIRADRIDDESDIAPTEIVSPILATIFPQINPTLTVHYEFSALNIVSVRAVGGKLVLNGIYDADSQLLDE